MNKKPTFENRLPLNWIESTPEWRAAFGQISAEEYLALLGEPEGSFVEVRYGEGGENPLWRKAYKREKD